MYLNLILELHFLVKKLKTELNPNTITLYQILPQISTLNSISHDLIKEPSWQHAGRIKRRENCLVAMNRGKYVKMNIIPEAVQTLVE